MPAKKSSHFYSVIILSYRSQELLDDVKRRKIYASDAAPYDVTHVYLAMIGVRSTRSSSKLLSGRRSHL